MAIGHEIYDIKTYSFGISNYNYIVSDKKTGTALIIDPSWEYKKLVNKLNQLDLKLQSILLTHSHFDHVNLVDSLTNTFNPQVYMSRVEIDFSSFRCRNLNGLNDLNEVIIGETKVLSILTPGHTPGSMCYFVPGSLFTGDTIFIEGCGACSFMGGSAEAMFDSVQRVKYFNSNVKIYPGHSYGQQPGQTIEYLEKNNIYFQIEKKEDFIKFRMRKNQRGLFKFN